MYPISLEMTIFIPAPTLFRLQRWWGGDGSVARERKRKHRHDSRVSNQTGLIEPGRAIVIIFEACVYARVAVSLLHLCTISVLRLGTEYALSHTRLCWSASQEASHQEHSDPRVNPLASPLQSVNNAMPLVLLRTPLSFCNTFCAQLRRIFTCPWQGAPPTRAPGASSGCCGAASS